MGRILVVEDNSMNRRLMREVLRYGDHEIVEASTVVEGLACLHQEIPNLVLLDIQIPGGGGEALLRAIRADEKLASLRVIAVTAQAMQGDRERFLEIGFDGYIPKPINTRTFVSEIEAFIHSGSS